MTISPEAQKAAEKIYQDNPGEAALIIQTTINEATAELQKELAEAVDKCISCANENRRLIELLEKCVRDLQFARDWIRLSSDSLAPAEQFLSQHKK